MAPPFSGKSDFEKKIHINISKKGLLKYYKRNMLHFIQHLLNEKNNPLKGQKGDNSIR